MMMVRGPFCTILVGALLIGCGQSGPPPAPPGVEVSGKIQLANGTYLNGGRLVLRPIGGIHGAFAPIQPDGSFVLVNPAGKKEVVPGKYHVYVVPSETDNSMAKLIPARYQNTEDGDSDLVVDIQEPTTTLMIRLKN